MHICYLCNEYPPGRHGGVGSFTQTLARKMVERGHQVSVVGVYPQERAGVENDRGVRVIRLPRTSVPKAGFLINGARLRKALRQSDSENPIDVIEGPELSLALLNGALEAKKVIRMNGGHHFFAVTLGKQPAPWRSWLERRSFAKADRICSVSRYVGETTRELLRLGDRPIEVLPNPVDTSFFCPRPDLAEIPGLIVFAGTVCEKKGIRQLVQAMPAIVEAVPHARLWVLGRDWYDPKTGQSYMAQLREQIPELLKERIEFKGAIEHDELPGYYAKAQVCAFPSHMEAQGIVAPEGMAMEKVVIFGSLGPGPEIIEDGVSGLLCDPHDPISIAEAVIKALSSSSLRERLGAAARQRAETAFSVEVLVVRNEQFYESCL